MKKLFVFTLVVLIGAVAWCRFSLGESGAIRFMTKMEALAGAGKADEICDMFHDDLEVDVTDSSGETPMPIQGGKQQLCELTKMSVMAMASVPHSKSVSYENVTATRDWLHFWTSDVSYVENRTMSISGANVSMSTRSEGTMTLVQTITGVKLRKLAATIAVAQ